jgi:hypothetical protein
VAAGPEASGNWVSHLVPGEIDQICHLVAGQHDLPAIKVQVFTGQVGYTDHEGDPPRLIVFANVFFAAQERHERYHIGTVVGLEKKEVAGPEGWAVEEKPGKWLQINAPSNHKRSTRWYGEPFRWKEAVRISDVIAIVDLAYRETFEAKKEEMNPIPQELAIKPINDITFERPPSHNRLLLEFSHSGVSDSFIAFLKTKHRWKRVNGVGFIIGNLSPPLRPLSSSTILPKPPAARWVRR